MSKINLREMLLDEWIRLGRRLYFSRVYRKK